MSTLSQLRAQLQPGARVVYEGTYSTASNGDTFHVIGGSTVIKMVREVDGETTGDGVFYMTLPTAAKYVERVDDHTFRYHLDFPDHRLSSEGNARRLERLAGHVTTLRFVS
jgi:hypothetical protein